MKVIRLDFCTPQDAFVACLEERCRMLLVSVMEQSIHTLADLKLLLEQQAREIGSIYPNATPKHLTFIIHSYFTFEVLQICSGNITHISLSARKTQFELAFRDYDNARHS